MEQFQTRQKQSGQGLDTNSHEDATPSPVKQSAADPLDQLHRNQRHLWGEVRTNGAVINPSQQCIQRNLNGASHGEIYENHQMRAVPDHNYQQYKRMTGVFGQGETVRAPYPPTSAPPHQNMLSSFQPIAKAPTHTTIAPKILQQLESVRGPAYEQCQAPDDLSSDHSLHLSGSVSPQDDVSSQKRASSEELKAQTNVDGEQNNAEMSQQQESSEEEVGARCLKQMSGSGKRGGYPFEANGTAKLASTFGQMRIMGDGLGKNSGQKEKSPDSQPNSQKSDENEPDAYQSSQSDDGELGPHEASMQEADSQQAEDALRYIDQSQQQDEFESEPISPSLRMETQQSAPLFSTLGLHLHRMNSTQKRAMSEIQRAFQNFNTFDWDIKELNNLKTPPYEELQNNHNVFWYWVNSNYFPWNAHELFIRPGTEASVQDKKSSSPIKANEMFEEFSKNYLRLRQVSDSRDEPEDATVYISSANQNNYNSQVEVSLISKEERELLGNSELVQKLLTQKKFNFFREEVQQRLCMAESSDNPEEDEESNFDEIIQMLRSEVQTMAKDNRDDLKSMFLKVHNSYKQAMVRPAGDIKWHCHDREAYNATDMEAYGQGFLSYVDSCYVQDMVTNHEFYTQNYNEILLNVNFPSQLEQDFFKHIEEQERQKNDTKYRQILQQREADSQNGPPIDNERLRLMNPHLREQAMQEDARCAVCNSGEYEEDGNQIVFCGSCNIPVHQYCYGIDRIPEDDWICNNCSVFYSMRKGLSVRCMLCPRRGGAMKSTNLFACEAYYKRFSEAILKKKGIQYTADLDLDCEEESTTADRLCNGSAFTRAEQFEDKNTILKTNMQREEMFQAARKSRSEIMPQDKLNLHFIEIEAVHEIPEDYTFFLQRNEQILEEAVPMVTLYRYVHLSCAMWIHGPIIKPKAPVRLGKIDPTRFTLRCIICGKKEGACIQCQAARCQISFHVECARRENYCMDMERQEAFRGPPVFHIFCEKHRPRKQIKELEEDNRKKVEEICKFGKLLDKWSEIAYKANIKTTKQKRIAPWIHAPPPKPPSKREIMAQKRCQQAEQKEKLLKEKEEKRVAQLQEREQLKQDKVQKKQLEIQAKATQMPPPPSKRQLQREAAAVLKKKQLEDKANQAAVKAEAKKQQQQAKQKKEETKQPCLKWREKDKKTLLERVREKYVQLLKLRLNIMYIDPMRKIRAREERNKRKADNIQKQEERKRQRKLILKQKETCLRLSRHQSRDGLRNRNSLRDCEEQVEGISMRNDLTIGGPGELEIFMGNGIVDMTNVAPNSATVKKQTSVLSINENEDDVDDASIGEYDKEDSLSKESSSRLIGKNSKRDIEDLEAEVRGEAKLSESDLLQYYKLGNPVYATGSSQQQQFDWMVSLSKYDFPWSEVAFDQFSSAECFQTYRDLIVDEQSFNKRVLGQRERSSKKVIPDQLPSEKKQSTPLTNATNVPASPDQPSVTIVATTTSFCICQGKNTSDFYVYCEAGEENCPYNGWWHPNCTKDLCDLAHEEVEEIESWYCQACKKDTDQSNLPEADALECDEEVIHVKVNDDAKKEADLLNTLKMELDAGNMSRERAMSEKQEELLFGNMPGKRRKTTQIVPLQTNVIVEPPTLKNCLVANSVMIGSHLIAAPMTIAVSEQASELEESPQLKPGRQRQPSEDKVPGHIVNPAFLEMPQRVHRVYDDDDNLQAHHATEAPPVKSLIRLQRNEESSQEEYFSQTDSQAQKQAERRDDVDMNEYQQ